MIRCDSGTDSIVWMREVLYIQNKVSDRSLLWWIFVMDTQIIENPEVIFGVFYFVVSRDSGSLNEQDSTICLEMNEAGRCSYGKM